MPGFGKLGAWISLPLLGVAMVCLTWRPIHEETATADEAWILGAGYTYCKGMGFRMHPDQPPLAKMWSALPLMFQPVVINEEARSLFEGRTGYYLDRSWRGDFHKAELLFPAGRNNWYYWPWYEGDRFGQFFLYGGENDADRLLAAARVMQAVLSLLTATVIFLWANQLAGPWAGLCSAALWAFNPVALAHGHIVQTDAGGTLTLLAAVWGFAHFVKHPLFRRALVAGLAYGLALATKLSALLLLPIFAVIAAVAWRKTAVEHRRALPLVRLLPVFALCGWLVIMFVYAPHWKPAPEPDQHQLVWLGIPSWFTDLRPILIPRDFFKAVALWISTTDEAHTCYLLGEFSYEGWWYYYPVAFALKTPIALLGLTVAALIVLCRRLRSCRFEELVPWIAAGLFFALAMLNKTNVGVRHILPVYGLLSVAIGSQLATIRFPLRAATLAMVGWLAMTSILAHPFYIEYFNEFAGGSRNGYKFLLDSNFDWGQDLKRLKKYLAEQHINHCYVATPGLWKAIEYYGLPATVVDAPAAGNLKQGTLVISAALLMRPEWAWLREHHQPIDRVAHTMFVYQLGAPTP